MTAPRPIRSFVLRQSRLSNAQRRAIETLLPRYGAAYSGSPLDFRKLFARVAPTVLEIGFGMGETTAQIALSRPDINYLAIEVHSPGIGALLKLIDEAHISNVRLVPHDAAEVVRDMIAPQALAGAHIFFPDPWPKTRHHKRRLIQPDFVALLAERLAPGAYLHVATDWGNYAEQILAVLSAEPKLANSALAYSRRPDYRPLTKFEQRGLRLGHRVWDLIFVRR